MQPTVDTITTDPAPVLVLNETRKTLLASRLRLADRERLRRARKRLALFPGDGVWVEACNHVSTARMPVPLDLLFLDADHRVVAKLTQVRPGTRLPKVSVARGVLELPAGTILSTGTDVGDHILIEPIIAEQTAL